MRALTRCGLTRGLSLVGQVVRIGRSYQLGPADNLGDLVARTSSSWAALVNNNAPLLNMLWNNQLFAGRAVGDVAPIAALEPGLAVFDINFRDLNRATNYSGLNLCIVSLLTSNCI